MKTSLKILAGIATAAAVLVHAAPVPTGLLQPSKLASRDIISAAAPAIYERGTMKLESRTMLPKLTESLDDIAHLDNNVEHVDLGQSSSSLVSGSQIEPDGLLRPARAPSSASSDANARDAADHSAAPKPDIKRKAPMLDSSPESSAGSDKSKAARTNDMTSAASRAHRGIIIDPDRLASELIRQAVDRHMAAKSRDKGKGKAIETTEPSPASSSERSTSEASSSSQPQGSRRGAEAGRLRRWQRDLSEQQYHDESNQIPNVHQAHIDPDYMSADEIEALLKAQERLQKVREWRIKQAMLKTPRERHRREHQYRKETQRQRENRKDAEQREKEKMDGRKANGKEIRAMEVVWRAQLLKDGEVLRQNEHYLRPPRFRLWYPARNDNFPQAREDTFNLGDTGMSKAMEKVRAEAARRRADLHKYEEFEKPEVTNPVQPAPPTAPRPDLRLAGFLQDYRTQGRSQSDHNVAIQTAQTGNAHLPVHGEIASSSSATAVSHRPAAHAPDRSIRGNVEEGRLPRPPQVRRETEVWRHRGRIVSVTNTSSAAEPIRHVHEPYSEAHAGELHD